MAGPQKMPIQIPLGGGLRTDIDPKLLPLGNVLELENARQVRTGEIVARYGGAALSDAVNSSVLSAIATAPWQLANFRNDLIRLGRVGATPISRWSPAMSKWTYCGWGDYSNLQPSIQSGLKGPFATRVTPVAAFGQVSVGDPDSVVSGGYVFTACVRDTTKEVFLSVSDEQSGELVWKYSATGVTNRLPRLAVANGYAVMAWVNSTSNTIDAMTVQISTIKNTSPTVVTALSVGTTVAATPQFDVQTYGSLVALAWTTSTNKTFGAELTPSTGSHVNYEIKDSGGASIDSADALGFIQNDVGFAGLGLAMSNHTTVGVQSHTGFQGTGNSTLTRTLDATLVNVASITAAFTSSSASALVNAVYTVRAAALYNYRLRFAEWSGGAFAVDFVRSVHLKSKIFSYAGMRFVVAQYLPGGDEGSTYFLFNVPNNMASAPPSPSGTPAAPLAKVMVGDAAQALSSVLPSVMVSGDVMTLALGRRSYVSAAAASTTSYNGVSTVTITGNQTLGNAVEAADSLYVPGALLGAFDGQVFADDGFAVDPLPPGVVTSVTPGGLTAAGKYRYVQVFMQQDANGRVCRSAPSLSAVVTLGGADTSADVTLRTLRITQRSLRLAGAVMIETYRTGNILAGASETDFRLLRTDPNDPTADTIAFNDGQASVASGEQLYTSIGILPNEVTPGFLAVAVFQNRLWGLSMDFGAAELWYTDEFTPGVTPRWNGERVLPVEDQHGQGFALATLDDKLILWKRDAIYAVLGSGPDALGNGGNYQAQLIARGVGSSNPQSIVVSADGAWFQSTSQRAGRYMVTRGLSVEYMGAPVQKYSDADVAAVLVPGQSQVRFYSAAGRTLVYDLVTQIWSTYTGQPARHATCWAGTTAAYARAGLTDVVTEDTSGVTYTEAGVSYGVRVVTPWIQLANLNGYERWYRMQGVGETVGAHTVTAYLYKDFDDTIPLTTQTVTPGARWDWEVRYSSKLSALKVALVCAPSATGSAGAKMTALAMIIGVKAGLKKLPSVNRTAAVT